MLPSSVMGISDSARAPSIGAGNGDASAASGEAFDAKAWLSQATSEMRESFARNRRVISYGEYFALFGTEARRQVRSAAQYLRDVFDHFGTESVRTPRGPM